jgi:hypothetical protein
MSIQFGLKIGCDTSTTAGITAATTHWQRSATTVIMLPSGAGPEATLEVARQLLHNPLGPCALPSAIEQWRHDVDQLIIAAINTPPHGGGR